MGNTERGAMIFIGLIVLLAACGDDVVAPGPFEVEPVPGLQGFEAELDALRVELRIPGMSAAIAKDGVIAWSRGFGVADIETESPVTSGTPFHLASLTKPFAAAVLMQLVEEGLVSLDDPVSDYGVVLSGPGTIRVRHLLTHTSEGVPGSNYQYSGNRFGELDHVIEGASGRSFADLLSERILQPLGLRLTAPNPESRNDFNVTGLDRAQFSAAMAAGHEVVGQEVRRRAHPTYFGTAAGLVSTAEDMAGFSLAIDQGRLLADSTWQAVFTPAQSNAGDPLPYGLGWFIQEHQGHRLQWHYGYWTTNSSLIVRAPDDGLTFVVLANTQTLSSPYGLGADNDVLRSAVARLFVEAYVTGGQALPGG